MYNCSSANSHTLLGDHVPHRDLIEVVLEALPEEFNAVFVYVNSKFELISLDELESQFLTQESRNERFMKVVFNEPTSISHTKT